MNDQLHKISRQIVNEALETNAMIVMGNLKEIRKTIRARESIGNSMDLDTTSSASS